MLIDVWKDRLHVLGMDHHAYVVIVIWVSRPTSCTGMIKGT